MLLGLREAFPLVVRTLGNLALLYLPALAVVAFAAKRGCRNIIVAGLITLATAGAYAYVEFWLSLAAPRPARYFALAVPIASLLALIALVPRLELAARKVITALLLPIFLSGAFSLFVLAAGFVYGGFEMPLITPVTRFSHPLPPDNAIPFIFSEGINYGHIPRPMLGEWLSSDRPPLQTGFVLAQRAYNPEPRQVASQVTGVLAQSTWILALWLFLIALNIEARLIAWILAACLSSGFVLVNTFFVWPKLLAAAYTLGVLALLFNKATRSLITQSKAIAALCGILTALAMLAHGGAVFAFLGATATLLALRTRIPIKQVVVLLATAFLLYLPWLLYQKFYDPPGNRLLKMHLAGVLTVDSRPFGQALEEAYAAKNPGEIAALKWSNWVTATGRDVAFFAALLHITQPNGAARLRQVQFFFFVPTLGFLAFGIPAFLFGICKRWRGDYWQTSMHLWLFILLTIVIWCLLMFGPAATVMHQGTYATVLLGFAACCLSLWSLSPKLAQALIVLQAVVNVLLYSVFMPKPQPDPRFFVTYGTLRLGTLLTALVAAAATLWLLYCIAGAASEDLREVNTAH